MKNNKDMLNIFKTDFRRSFKNTIIWATVMILIGLVYYGVYPSMKDLIIDKLEAMPDEILTFISASGDLDMSDFNYYFAMIYAIIQIPLIIYAAMTGGALLHSEEKLGTIEYLYSQKTNRKNMYIAKALVGFVNILIVFLAALVIVVILGFNLASDTFIFSVVLTAMLFSFAGIVFFYGLSFLLSSILNKHFDVTKITVGTFLGGYLLGYIGSLIDNLNFVKIFSPINLISSDLIVHSEQYGIGTGTFNSISVVIYFLLGISCLIAGGFLYNKKDLT